MATHPIPELLSLWENGKITSEQAIGHLFQTVAALAQRLAATEQRLHRQDQPDPAAAPTRTRRPKPGSRPPAV